MPAQPVERSRTIEGDGETADGPVLDLPAAPVTEMIARGRQRGYVTHDELNRALPPGETSADRIEYAMTVLSELCVAVTEGEEAATGVEEGRPEAAPAAAAPKSGADDIGLPGDPVGMYLREMGGKTLLTREGEVALAKRIEAGRQTMLDGLRESPLTMRAVLAWRDAIRAGSMALREAIDIEAKHLVHRIRRHWPRTRIVFRGDSHYGRTQAMAWCEENGVDYIFGLAGNRALHALAYEAADDLKVRRAEAGADRMRAFATFAYAARSWDRERRVVARLEASTRGFDARYIVTSLEGDPRRLYEDVYCARGQAENLIKLHKGQLASDRTSCQSPIANQLRLVLHTAAYWLMLTLRDTIPRAAPLARAEFATLRLRLLKIGARVIEKATRVRIHFTSACPDAALFRLLAGRLAAAGP